MYEMGDGTVYHALGVVLEGDTAHVHQPVIGAF